MDKKQELIKQCRYYKGEEQCPLLYVENGYRSIWECEANWVKLELDSIFTSSNFKAPFGYNKIWEFDIDTGDTYIPMNLLKMLYSYFCYYEGVSPSDIQTKQIALYIEEIGWIKGSVYEAFIVFLKDRYYSEESISQPITT